MVLNFDMDGTLVDFYGVDSWLDDIHERNARPYIIAKPLVRMSTFARLVNSLQSKGFTVNIISWLAKDDSNELEKKACYDRAVTKAKIEWLEKHLPSVHFDNIIIVDYGTPKHELAKGFLFDDDLSNRAKWGYRAYDEKSMLEILKDLNRLDFE